MERASSGPTICRVCGAALSPLAEFCKTCHIVDQWMLSAETLNLKACLTSITEEELMQVIQFIKRMKERDKHPRKKSSRRKTPQEFDFALQEIEKTTRGLELTSIEAVGVLEMVKQSFVEEMFYEDYRADDDDDDDDLNDADE